MAFKVEYLGGGKVVKTVTFNGPREDAAKTAVDSIGHLNAQLARILDEEGKLVALVDLDPRS